MRRLTTALALLLALFLTTWDARDGVAQTTTTEQGSTPPSAPAATPSTPGPAATPPGAPPTTQSTPSPVATPVAAPGPKAKDLEGRDVFGSDAQQIGKVTKVETMPDGKVKGIEVHSSGFFGFFSTAYVVPAEKINLKSGRVELSMTSEQAKQFVK